ncbi:hypothetical protein R1sor_007564 [Riccia sorocarpa]|uniref:Uncharacterized protein n=1 Tax=Riccia sorocarpa TaxID=122646 RepID=A0ABD3HR61_9MARC
MNGAAMSNSLPGFPFRGPPGRNDPLPESPSPDASNAGPAGNFDEDGEENESGAESDDDQPDGGKMGSRIFGRDWQTMALIEAKKELSDFVATLRGRAKILSEAQKLARVQESLARKGVKCEHKLPRKFLDEWRVLMDTFQGNRTVHKPPCLESSSKVPTPTSGSGTSGSGGPSTPEAGTSVGPAEFRSGAATAAAEPSNAANSGMKRKKMTSMSASLMVEAIDRMTESTREISHDMQKFKTDERREKHALVREIESQKQDRADSRRNRLADVLGQMVVAIGELARSKRARG